MEEIDTFPKRLALGKEGERKLRRLLTFLRFTIVPDGQENNVPPELHAALRFIYDDPTVRAIRHRPDILAFRKDFPLAHWEAKVSTEDQRFKNFTVEMDCFDELMALYAARQRCVLAYLKQDKAWVASWVQHVVVVEKVDGPKRQLARGARTPYYKISQSSFFPLSEFIRDRKKSE